MQELLHISYKPCRSSLKRTRNEHQWWWAHRRNIWHGNSFGFSKYYASMYNTLPLSEIEGESRIWFLKDQMAHWCQTIPDCIIPQFHLILQNPPNPLILLIPRTYHIIQIGLNALPIVFFWNHSTHNSLNHLNLFIWEI